MNLGRRRAAGRPSSSPVRVDSDKNALTAAGQLVRRPQADMMRRLVQSWQTRAFAYYDLLGEIKYAAQFYSRALASLELFAAETNEMADGRQEIGPTTNPQAIELLDRIQDPGGGRSGLLSSYGRLMFLVGEAYLFVTVNKETDEEQWEMLSTNEIRLIGSTYMRIKAPSLIAEEYAEPKDNDYEPLDVKSAVAYRLWKRHPQYSQLADSTIQGVLDLCEELVLLTQAVRARARNRMVGPGILFLDDKLSPKPLEPAGDENPDEDPFLSDIIEAATTAITDEGSAAAVAPVISRIPVPEGKSIRDLVYHLQLSDPTQLYPETGMRRECIDRIAIGLDLPPEILTGITDANHWSAWMIDEQVWKAHLQPIAQQLVDDLTSSYFRPALRAAGVQDWQRYSIDYDAAEIINHPDRGKDAMDLYSSRAIGKHALREAKGFDDEDEPSQEELSEMIGVAVRDGGLATTGIATLRKGSELESGTGEVVVPAEAAPGEAATTTTPGGQSNDAQKEPPQKSTADTPPEALTGSNGAADRILGASALAVQRAREVAGNRLKGLAKRDPDVLRLVDDTPARMIATVLGREKVRALNAPPERELVSGAHGLILDSLRLFGLDPAAAEVIASSIEQHAALTLYDEQPRPLPPSFENYLRGALNASKQPDKV